MRHLRTAWLGLIVLASMAGCSLTGSNDVVPPTLSSLDTLPTAVFLTENAPPPGFSTVTAFDPVEATLSARQGWAYTVTGHFEGTFDESGAPAEGTFTVQVQTNELGEARRVVLEVEGSALSAAEASRRLEGVRLSNDYYIVDTNGRCTAGGEGAKVIGDLSAGQLIGGVRKAVPTGQRQEIEGVPAWQYTFAPEDVRLPAVRRGADSTLDIAADLWIAPGYNAVLRYELNLTVGRVRILWGDDTRTVSGTLYLRYDLSIPDFDSQPNISIPHGC
jgi:hypothetical protein